MSRFASLNDDEILEIVNNKDSLSGQITQLIGSEMAFIKVNQSRRVIRGSAWRPHPLSLGSPD